MEIVELLNRTKLTTTREQHPTNKKPINGNLVELCRQNKEDAGKTSHSWPFVLCSIFLHCSNFYL